ncbi:MAG: Rdx family protein [Planctomycetota bacterium]
MPKATSLAAAIKKAFPKAQVDTNPGGRGDFVVKADGKLLWDKRKRSDDAFPEHRDILSQLPKA